MNEEDYRKLFSEPMPPDNTIGQTEFSSSLKLADTRAGRALAYAHDIRKFEIELYWKRATYFWTFIGAAFAAYALTYKSATEHEPWLSLIFSSLGFLFSFAWHLVNRGSKYWQNNWERHVDLLEDLTLGPLYKIIIEDKPSINFLTSSGSFSVTKINQILSFFMIVFWFILIFRSLWPISSNLEFYLFKFLIVSLVIICSIVLGMCSRSSNDTKTSIKIKQRILNFVED